MALEALHQHGFTTVALTPDASATDIRDLQTDGLPTALVVGAEGPGLTEEALTTATVKAKISMANNVDSLNVATAAAIAFHQLQPA